MNEKMFPIMDPEIDEQTPMDSDDDIGDIDDNPETDPDPVFDQAEERIQKLERILSDIAPGWQVQITRIQPGWAKGHLETIDVTEDKPIDLDYLARTWGGDVLRLRVKDRKRVYVGGCDVHLYSHPPKRWCKEIRPPGDTAEEKNPPLSGLAQMETMLNVMDRLKGKPELSTAEVLQLFLKTQKREPQPDMMGQFLAMATAFKQLRGIFGDDAPSQPAPVQAAPDGDNMIGQLNSLLDTYLKIKATAEPRKQLVSGPVSNPGNPVQTSPITNALKTMDSKQIAETFLGSVGQLPEEKRTAIFQNIFDMLGIQQGTDDDDDEQLDDDDPEIETLDD